MTGDAPSGSMNPDKAGRGGRANVNARRRAPEVTDPDARRRWRGNVGHRRDAAGDSRRSGHADMRRSARPAHPSAYI